MKSDQALLLVKGDFKRNYPPTKTFLDTISTYFLVRDTLPFFGSSTDNGNLFKYVSSYIFYLAYLLKCKNQYKTIVLYVGFGSSTLSLIHAKFISSILGIQLVFHKLTLSSHTSTFYKKKSPHKVFLSRLTDHFHIFISDILLFDSLKVINYYSSFLGSDSLLYKSKVIPLYSKTSVSHQLNPAKFQPSEVLHICWWGQPSEIHGITNIVELIKSSQNLPVCYHIITDVQGFVHYADCNFLDIMASTNSLNVIFYPWKYSDSPSDSELIESVSRMCDVSLGCFNFSHNIHLDKVYLNKEIESVVNRLPLITRHRQDFFITSMLGSHQYYVTSNSEALSAVKILLDIKNRSQFKNLARADINCTEIFKNHVYHLVQSLSKS